MYELSFVNDLVEERLVKGKFRWLANFREIHRDFQIGEFTIPIYATGGLEEKGFLLSKVFSFLVTPKYKVHFLFYTSPEIDVKFLRRFIISCKSKFGSDDWIFIGLVQNKPLDKGLKEAVENIADPRVGIASYSLTSKDEASSKNVLGKALEKQLKLTEAKFEAFDWPNYLKSFTIVFFLGTLLLVAMAFIGNIAAAIQPLTLLLTALFSLILGYQIYKTNYHVALTLNAREFLIREGKDVTSGKWSDFTDLTIYITPRYETRLRLYSKAKTLDLPLSRVGISRRDFYNTVRQLISRK